MKTRLFLLALAAAAALAVGSIAWAAAARPGSGARPFSPPPGFMHERFDMRSMHGDLGKAALDRMLEACEQALAQGGPAAEGAFGHMGGGMMGGGMMGV